MMNKTQHVDLVHSFEFLGSSKHIVMCFPIIGKANVQVMCIKPKEHGGILVLKMFLK